MSRWGLTYKSFEVVWPEEWNRIIDALDELYTLTQTSGLILIPAVDSTMSFGAPTSQNVMPFSAERGLIWGYPLPRKLKAVSLYVQVIGSNTNGEVRVYLRKNESLTDMYVSIPANTIGLFVREDVTVEYMAQDRIDFYVDVSRITSGTIRILSMTAVMQPML